MAQRTDIFDLGRLSLHSGEGRRIDTEVTVDPLSFGGQTYEIGGPQRMSMLELHRAIFEITGQKPEIVPLPGAAVQGAFEP